ncbi:hypothetical protein [Planobispora rosea]|uniref:hypothetical protein n=1 Tax=Planobispora rosea TaxID=35762 RepID=UPI000839FA6C|nr:hypothetical protein [Planobispora rosea]
MIDHYRRLFERHQWLLNGLCWTVVQPLDDDLTVDDLLWRLNGGRDPERRGMYFREAEELEEGRLVLLLVEEDMACGFLSASGDPTPDAILAELSRGARVWMTTWHFKGGETLLYAAGGEIRAKIYDFVFAERLIEHGDQSILADFRTLLDGLGPQDYLGKYCAAFAFIEAATGVGLETEWLEAEEAPVVLLDNPGRG